MKYQLACEVTGTEAVISGGRHRLVKKPNGMRFFMDDFFIDVLNGINDKGIVEKVKARYGVTGEYVSRAVETVVKGGFVKEISAAGPVLEGNPNLKEPV